MDLNIMKRSEIDSNLKLKNEIIQFLKKNDIDLDWTSNFKQIIYHYNNRLTEIPKCYCGQKNNFKSTKIGYRKTCSVKCSNSSNEKKNKTRKVKLEKYGDENYNNKNKMMNTKLEKYGDETFNNREKASITNLEKYGFNTPMKNQEVIKKGKITKMEIYGFENYNNIAEIKKFWSDVELSYIKNMVSKIKKTKLEKYNDENYNNSSQMSETKYEKYGFYYVNFEKANDTKKNKGLIFFDTKDWDIYKKKVKSITRNNKKKLYERWDGYDYYDGESIKGYQSFSHTHRFYPTIDHKTSVWWGFNNLINPEVIGSIENLCITKRYINSTKSKLIEDEFKNYKSFLETLKSI